MPIGLQRSYSYGRRDRGKISRGRLFKNQDERIKDLRETLRLNKYLVKYYLDLISPNSPCSYEIYKARLDKEAAAIREQQNDLEAKYAAANNGHIPELQRQVEKIEAKLKKLKIERAVAPGRIHKAKDLREKLAALEQQLKDEGFNVEDLMDAFDALEKEEVI